MLLKGNSYTKKDEKKSMNKFIRAMACVPYGAIKMGITKLFHLKAFHGPVICLISPFTEITMDSNATLQIGDKFKMRDGAKVRVRKGATCNIGNNVSMNSNDIIICHESITIGDDCQLSPNVQIYDHDHDYRDPNGIGAMHYKTSPISIGKSVWIGANTVILRGTDIGDNCVIAAGSIVKGKYPSNSVIIQKRATEIIRGGYWNLTKDCDFSIQNPYLAA